MNGSAIQRLSTRQDAKAMALVARKSTFSNPSAVIHLLSRPRFGVEHSYAPKQDGNIRRHRQGTISSVL